MGVFGEWYIHPGPPIEYDDYPRELVLTNGKREQAYIPERTCHDTGARYPGWTCSECGHVDSHALNYCPKCGARITEEDTDGRQRD